MDTAAPVLPRVEGRHRNRALAAARRARAVELRTQGLTYEDIARELGYANRGTVFRVVSNALAAREGLAVDDLRSLEAERLDALQVGIWQRAMEGDIQAAMVALRIIGARCRLLGLDTVRPSHSASPAGPRTVVVPPST